MTEKLGHQWSDQDFESMGWHDNFIESLIFPDENLKLCLNINYILDWIPQKITGHCYKFRVALAKLSFHNVLNLTFKLNFENSTSIFINEIVRCSKRLSPNKKMHIWDYRIITDQGDITFDSTGFTQTLISEPKISDSLRYSDI